MPVPARGYTSMVAGVSVSAAQDFWEVQPADDKPIEMFGAEFAQSSDVGDAAEEILRVAVRRGNTTSGSVGTTPTEAAVNVHDAAVAVVTEANNTTKASTAGATLYNSGFNIRIAPTPFWFPEHASFLATQAETTMCHELVAAPADAVTIDQTLWMREY